MLNTKLPSAIAELVKAGAAIHWLHAKEKRPIGDDWSTKPVATLEELKRSYRDGYNVGIRLGKPSLLDGYYVHCIDVDVHDSVLIDEVWNVLKSKFPGVMLHRFPCVISGSGSGSFHLYIVTDAPYRSKKIAYSAEFVTGKDGKKHRAWEIEFFGTGKQVVLPPSIHPNGNPYRYEREFDYDALPKVKAHIIEALFEDGPRLEGNGEKLGMTPKEIRSALFALPSQHAEDRQLWIEAGMAVHNETDGSPEGRKIWMDWSKQSSKFDPKVAREQWRSLKGNTSEPITMRTVMDAVRKAELLGVADLLNSPDDEDEDEGDEATKKSKWIAGDPDISIMRQSEAPAPAFPVEIFGKVWEKKIKAMARNAGAPVDYVAAALLSLGSGLVGNARWVQAHGEWIEPIVLWTISIGSPSANKTPAFRKLVSTVNAIEKEWGGPFLEQRKQWEERSKIADGMRKRWESTCIVALEAGKEPPDMPEVCEIGAPPKRRRATLQDTTTEALGAIYDDNPRGITLYRDELSGWFGNQGRYSNGNDIATWLESYTGGAAKIDRKSSPDPVIIDRFGVAILGGIQPERLDDMLAGADDGLVARFLPFWPEFEPIDFVFDPEPVERLKEILLRLAELLPNEDGSPVLLPFSKRALKVFAEWKNKRIRRERNVASRLGSAFGKADGHVIRSAATIQLLKWAADEFNEHPPEEISVETIEGVIRAREEYFKPMQLRVFSQASIVPEIRIAKSIAEWIVAHRLTTFNASQMRRSAGIKGIHSSSAADLIDAALAHLVALNWIDFVEVEGKAKGRPKKDYVVNERLWEFLDQEGE